MIKFKTITYKNILSVGQAPITLDLSGYRISALYGSSGSGKSLFLDALSFVLFGKAFRDINKPDLVNTINGKGLLVEVEFSIGKDEYHIRRGLKPAIFEIRLNGELRNQESHLKDQQKYLEDQILKMNWKIFTSVVMLGAANYTPFMRLKPSDRKKMVESILGIDIFSTMNALIKTKISDEMLIYKSAIDKRDSLKQQELFLVDQQKNFEAARQMEIKLLTDKFLGLKNKKEEADLKLLELEQKIEIEVSSFDPKVEIPEFNETFTETFDESFTEIFTDTFIDTFDERPDSEFDTSEKVARHASLLASMRTLADKIKELDQQSKFYTDHDNCPTCSQKIDENFRCQAIENHAKTKIGLIEEGKNIRRESESIKLEIDNINKAKQEYTELLLAFRIRKQEFEQRRSEFIKRQTAFEQRRRSFEDRQRAFEQRRRDHEDLLKKANSLLDAKNKKFLAEMEIKKKEVENHKQTIIAILTEAKMVKEQIEDKKSKPLLDNTQEINRLSSERLLAEQQIDKSANYIKLMRESHVIIKDEGVKAEIMKRYVPTLNKYINEYLAKMGMFVLFELDQEFNDTIRSRHRDVLSYANYSEGERQRIDLAVLLAWRHLAQAQSAVNTNLLILDEVLDSYLDQGTTETILTLMKSEAFQNFNIIIISHKDGISDSFNRTIHFTKKNNFTTISS